MCVVKKNMEKRVFVQGRVAACVAVVLLVFALSGCGGGGGGGDNATGASNGATTGYAMRAAASAPVGPNGAVLSDFAASLDATLAATQTVTLYERFYVSGRPAGIIGPIYDIRPDGVQFAGGGAELCISYRGSGQAPGDLQIYTGANFSEPVASYTDTARQMICARLAHASPYGIKRATRLTVPEFTIFADLNTKNEYQYKVETETGTDADLGAFVKYRIAVYCNLQCIEGGDRFFTFIQGGANNGDLYIRENGNYPLWWDAGNMKWTNFYSEAGAVEAGIAYLLAAQYVYYFTGDTSMPTFIAQLDPASNMLNRYIDFDPDEPGFDRYIALVRDAGSIVVTVRGDGTAERSYTITESTAAISKYAISGGTYVTTTALPSDAAYTTLRTELVDYINQIIGYDDTPDETAGDAYDIYTRYTPNQELFAINTRNLITGYGWNNLEAIEAYYRDRQETMYTGPYGE